jgi:hypothetical protein
VLPLPSVEALDRATHLDGCTPADTGTAPGSGGSTASA